MASSDIIAEVSKPEFYTRVSFISLKVAQNVASEDPATANHENRTAYSSRIFRGDEDALMLSMHLVSSNPSITATIEESGGAAVPDGDIEFALATIWDSRANAFAPPPKTPPALPDQWLSRREAEAVRRLIAVEVEPE